jgi:hypothetical protein
MKTFSMMKPFVATLAVCVPAIASADDSPLSKYGMSVTIGGGFVGFVDGDTRDYATDGNGWEGRLAFGTRSRVAIEAAYVGTMTAIDALGLDTDANLLGTGVEGAARFNLLDGQFKPYVHAGAGWMRYDITNASYNTSSIDESDNLITIPVGAGLGFQEGPVLIDLRGTYRVTTEADMFSTLGTEARLDTWSANANIGFEF